MPRVIRHPQVRRAEIMDKAFGIFLARGYEQTSLNDVIAEAGMSKGMFYHHFASKEALLAGLFERVTEQTFDALRPVVERSAPDPLTRLRDVLNRSAEIRLEQAEVTRSVFASLYRPESQVLFERLNEAWTARFTPVLAAIIRDGVAAGVLVTFDPDGVADMILQLAVGTKLLIAQGIRAATPAERDAVADRLATRLRLHALALSRVLGLADGSLAIGPPDFAHALLARLNPLSGAPAPGA